MSSKPSSHIFNIIAFCFEGQQTAKEIEQILKRDQKLAGYKILAEAVVEVDAQGKPHVHEPGRGGLGSGIGAAAGGLLGLIGGPAGLLAWAVAGSVIGGVSGHYLGRAIPAKDLEALGRQMQPDSSAFLALVEDVETERVIDGLDGFNADVLTLTLGDEAAGVLAMAVEADIEVAPDASQDAKSED